MLSREKRAGLEVTDWSARRHGLSGELHKAMNCVHGIWDFSVDGGAVGDFSLKDADGAVVKVPSGALVLNAIVHVKTACTSGGAATVDVQLEGANDILAAQAVAGLTLNAKIQGIPDFATLSDSLLTTAERTLQLSVNTAALTAGKIHVYVFYVWAE